MRYTSLLLAVACTASALRIPTAVRPPKFDLARLVHEQQKQVLELKCEECSGLVAEEERHDEYSLHLEFDADGDRGLAINGQPLLPAFGSPAAVELKGTVMRGENKAFYGQWVGEYKLSFALERLEPIRSKNEEEMLIPVRFTILAVGGQSVKVDTVSVDLLKTGEDLIVMTVGTIPFNATPGASTCDEANSWSLCRLTAIVRSRLSVMMAKANKWSGCHKKGPFGRIGGKKHGGKHGKHGKHGEHHRQHSQAQHYGHMIHQTLRFFVIPALLGVIGGLMASAVGMIVGQVIVALWTRFGRGGKKGNASQRARLVEDEKDGLLDSELPPQYEVPPQYQDIEAIAVEEKQ